MVENYQKLLEYGLRILSKKRYTIREMEKKLTRYGKKMENLSPDSTQQVIERLKELRYLDDQNFARDFIDQRIKLRPRGRMLLKRELMAKGLAKSITEQTLEKVEFDELEAAVELLSRKMERWLDDAPLSQKAKAYRFLYSRGFKQDDIYKAIESCYNRLV